MSRVECWELFNGSANIAVAILWVNPNIHSVDGSFSIYRNGRLPIFDAEPRFSEGLWQWFIRRAEL
jgi:hypothetical protein